MAEKKTTTRTKGKDKGKANPATPLIPSALAPDFRTANVRIADHLIEVLLLARDALLGTDRKLARRAAAFVERMHQAEIRFDDGADRRRLLMVVALEAAATDWDCRLLEKMKVKRITPGAFKEMQVQVAMGVISHRLSAKSVPRDVLVRAIELWPTTSKAKGPALHALAKALDCDMPTLMPKLRGMKKDRLDRRAALAAEEKNDMP